MLQTAVSRGEFLSLAKRAAALIQASPLEKGDRFALCFGRNHYHDLAFRLAATMTGTVPVTINWQADTYDRVCDKIKQTCSKLIVMDSFFDQAIIDRLPGDFPLSPLLHADTIEHHPEICDPKWTRDTDPESTRIIIFTSGTTGRAKGVKLPYDAYLHNRLTFEHFLAIKPATRLAVIIVNPLHHTNSTAITDWALRRPGSHIYLIEKYSANYWDILSDISQLNYHRRVAPTVSRHFDFLETLSRKGKLPLSRDKFKARLIKIDFLIGSAPVGPTTIRRLQKVTGRIPIVRFGSTETCLQVMGTPCYMSEKNRLNTFQKGWKHIVSGTLQPGYYIGRPHSPYTEARVVKSITPNKHHKKDKDFMADCPTGQAGYLITRGKNIMSGYVGVTEETQKIFHKGWYIGLKDICFTLKNHVDQEPDFYWVGRESTLLIRGGANYAFDQIDNELAGFVSKTYHLPRDAFDLAVVGLKIGSEHEDSCCVTMEVKTKTGEANRARIEKSFLDTAGRSVSKGARPDYIRFGKIPRNFKGAIRVKELAENYRTWLGLGEASRK